MLLNDCKHSNLTVQELYSETTVWTLVGLDGRLQKASKLKGIKNFKASEMGLLPVSADTWGGFAFIQTGKDRSDSSGSEPDLLNVDSCPILPLPFKPVCRGAMPLKASVCIAWDSFGEHQPGSITWAVMMG